MKFKAHNLKEHTTETAGKKTAAVDSRFTLAGAGSVAEWVGLGEEDLVGVKEDCKSNIHS